uniref:Uncharacterized protein n=1 Tax=Trichuris muris TaxID=70415 RepID=A0A5S6QTF5_TRIMR
MNGQRSTSRLGSIHRRRRSTVESRRAPKEPLVSIQSLPPFALARRRVPLSARPTNCQSNALDDALTARSPVDVVDGGPNCSGVLWRPVASNVQLALRARAHCAFASPRRVAPTAANLPARFTVQRNA